MNAQELEYVRIQLRAALVDDSGGTKGQLEAFAENPPADKERTPREPLHVVEIDNGHGDVQYVKAENSALYVLETRSRHRPMPPIKDSAFTSSKWRRAVLLLDTHQQAWIKYCYGFDLDFKYQTAICEYIWRAYMDAHKGQKIQKRKREKLVAMTWLAAQDNAAKQSNEVYKDRAAAVLARLVMVTYSTWSEVYAESWSEMKQFADELDVVAMRGIYRIVTNSADYQNDDIAKPNEIGHN